MSLVFRVTLRSFWPTVYSTSSTLEIDEACRLHQAGHYELTTADINGLIAGITPTERLDESVKHALQVREALAISNYHRFFKLFAAAPKMGAYLMDHFLSRERVAALAIMSRACVAQHSKTGGAHAAADTYPSRLLSLRRSWRSKARRRPTTFSSHTRRPSTRPRIPSSQGQRKTRGI
jgi:hypothetical protein